MDANQTEEDCSVAMCQEGNASLLSCNGSLINGTAIQCPPPKGSVMDTVLTAMGMCALLTLMIASGCHISLRTIWNHLKRPWAVLTGMACQYILLPVVAFSAALAFSLEPNTAVAFMICFTCPGGAYSNLASLAVDGDISLSFTLTTIAMVLAIGFMPLNLWIYSRYWAALAVTIPYQNSLITLTASLAAAALGYIITWRKPKAGLILSKVTGPLGFIFIIITTTLFLLRYNKFDWQMLVASAIVPGVAMGLAFLFAWLVLKKNLKSSKTVAFETGSQNTATAITFVTISYKGEELKELLPPATFGGHFVLCWLILIVGIYRLVMLAKAKDKKKSQQKEKPGLQEGIDNPAINQDPDVIEITRF